MAREAPPRNTIYTGMLAVTLGALVVGCLLLALELNSDYDWAMEAKGGPAITLPAKTAPAPATGGGGGMALTPPKDSATAKAPAEPAVVPSTIPPPAEVPAPVVAAAPPVALPTPKPTETAQPTLNPVKPTGIVPSPFKIPGGR